MSKALQYIKELWAKSSMTQRVLLLGAAAACVIGSALMFGFVTRPEMTLLYGGLSRQDAARIVEKIEEADVNYKLSADSTSIYVPKENVASLRLSLAKEGLPSAGSPGLELLDDMGPGMSPNVTNERIRQATEGELARSIRLIEGIEAVRVHIVPRERSAFRRREERQASASVIVTLCPGARLSKSNARAIVFMVATAVRGLDPKNVSVVDNHGTLIEGDSGDETVAKASTFMEHQISIEREMTAKIEELLEPMLGPDNYRVKVAVELQHVQKVTEEKTVDRDSRVPVREMLQSESSDMGKAQAVPAGNGIPARVGRGGGSTKKMTEEVSYAFDSARSVVTEIPGRPTQISVAAVVNLPGDQADEAITQKRLAELTELIRSTVGATRSQDVVTVKNVPFIASDGPGSPESQQTTREFYLELGKRVSLGVLVLGALVAIWIVTLPKRKEARAQARLAAASAAALEAPKQEELESEDTPALGQYTSDGHLLESDADEEGLEQDDAEYDQEEDSWQPGDRQAEQDDEMDLDLDDLPEGTSMARKVAVMMKRKPEKVKQLFRSWVESGDDGEE